MALKPPKSIQSSGEHAKAALSSPGSNVYVEISELSQSASGPGPALAAAMRVLARSFSCPYAAMHVRLPAAVYQEDCHFGPTDPAFWKSGVQSFLTDILSSGSARAKMLRARAGGAVVAYGGTALHDDRGSAIGALVLVIPVASEAQAASHLARLESLARYASFIAFHPRSNAPSKAAMVAPVPRAFASCSEFAFAITNELRNRLGAQQISLGLVVGRDVRILAISGLDDVPLRSPGSVSLRSAMEEALDAGEVIRLDADDLDEGDAVRKQYRLHRAWQHSAAGDWVASIPLRNGDEVAAILSIRTSAGAALTSQKLAEIRSALEGHIPALLLTRQAARTLARHAFDAIFALGSAMTTPGRLGAKVAAAASVALASWVAWGALPYKITVAAQVIVRESRHISVPFDAVLASVNVQEGDKVKTGDVLCEFDRTDLLNVQRELIAQRDVAQHEFDRNAAVGAASDAKLAMAQSKLLDAKLESLHRRIEQTSLRAGIDGVVVRGNLKQRIGEVLPRGALLMEIAPVDGWGLELELKETKVGDVEASMQGDFAASARPESSRRFRIVNILPSSVDRDNRHIFLAEAAWIEPPQAIGSDIDAGFRPGARGFATIHAGRRAVWWMISRNVSDRLRQWGWL